MESIWFILISILFTGFAVLDGFDIGVGSIYLLIAKSEEERHQARTSIGPIWGGNEVWLIAGAGTLFFAFPKAYAVLISKFYLAIFIILWFLVLRGLAIELRSQLSNHLWHTFWDVIFNSASVALAGLLGIVLGNLIRGIPLEQVGDPTLPFWTNFLLGKHVGLMDWYTVFIGGFSIATLFVQGANYIAWKTDGKLKGRAKNIASRGILVLIPYFGLVSVATAWVQPEFFSHFASQPLGGILPLITIISLIILIGFIRRGFVFKAFVASSLFIFTLLATIAFAIFPSFLMDVSGVSLTVYNSATSFYNLRVGLIWFSIGFALLLGYVVFMYRSFWGKVSSPSQDEAY